MHVRAVTAASRASWWSWFCPPNQGTGDFRPTI